jgi:hypothetical protein
MKFDGPFVALHIYGGFVTLFSFCKVFSRILLDGEF